MDDKQLEALDGFIKNFEANVNELQNYSQYLQLGGTTEELRQEALKILKKKAKAMRKAESKDDLKKVMKVNKYLEKRGLR